MAEENDFRKKKVSLAMVAERSGVSLATASRVLNPENDHPVNDHVRDRVIAAADDLNYMVNALARGVKIGRTRTIALIVHDVRDAFFGLMAAGVSAAANRAGYLTLVCNSDRDPDTELRYLQLALEQRVAGVLFVGGGFRSKKYQESLKRHLKSLEGYGGHAIALGSRGIDMSTELIDGAGGSRQATEHLLALGHRDIAFIGGPSDILTSNERRAGYESSLSAAGIEINPDLIAAGGFTRSGGAEAMNKIMDTEAHFTAVFAADDSMAIGALTALASRGVRIPEDVSLVGFDDLPDVQWFAPPLTTVAVPMQKMCEAAINRLMAMLDEPNGSKSAGRPSTEIHETELVVRESTAKPRRRKALVA
jgi:LacI family transcriptional regulator